MHEPHQLPPILEPPLLLPLASPEVLPTLPLPELNARLREVQILQTKRPLESSELKETITILQIIRGTLSTAGPRKAKASRKISSLADFEASLGLPTPKMGG